MNDIQLSSSLDCPHHQMSSTSDARLPNVVSPSTLSSSSSSTSNYDFLNSAYKSHDPLILKHGNGKESRVLFIPVCRTLNSFRAMGQKVVENMVESMSNNMNTETYNDECVAARHIIQHLSKCYPDSFNSVCKEIDPPSIRLDPFETTALIEHCDITRDTAYNKLNKFFVTTREMNILAPKRSLQQLQTGAPKKELFKIDVDCNTKKETKTQVAECVVTTMHENIAKRMERYLNDSSKVFDTRIPFNTDTPMFGYSNPDKPIEKSVLGVIGTDHGQKHSQFQLALHLLPSSARRTKKDKGHGILTIPFSTIKCDKENSNVLELTSPSVNHSIQMLEKNKLMSVKHGDKVHCFWINKNAINVRIQVDVPSRRRICYSANGSNFTYCLPDWCNEDDVILTLFTVMAPLHFLVVCDINAMFALQGRDGSSPNKCLKCDLSVAEWKRDRSKIGVELTSDLLSTMLRHKTVKSVNKAGMKYAPLFDLPPSRYLCPLLHLLLGLINDVMSKAIIPFALRMDGCCDVEREIRERLESNEEMSSRTRISLKAKIKKLVTKRTSKSNGTDTAIRNALTESGIYFENYHGGALNGNNCERLCLKAREVTNVCKNICLEQLRKHEREGTIPSYLPSVTDCEEKFETIAQVLEIADVVFSKCNVLSPNDEELADLEDSIGILEEKWYKACLPVTPKAHLTFKHLIIDIRKYNGLGDKQEQELERRHQLQKKWSNRLRNIRDKTAALSLQYSYEWSNTHPRVEHIISNVTKPTRKRKGHVLTLKEERECERLAVRQQNRDEVVCRLFMDRENSSGEEDN